MTEKKRTVRGTTPKGIFKYPNLIKPDYGTNEFPKKNGEYNVRLVLDGKAAQELIAKLEPEMEKAIAEAEEKFAQLPVATRKRLKGVTPNPYYTEVFDKETEEPTGQYEFRFKTTASGVDKKGERWYRTVPIFDAKGKPVKLKEIWSGTVGKVAYSVLPYFVAGSGAAGISLYLEAVQIIELNAGGGRSASEFGFSEEEGFEASEESHGFEDETTDEGSYNDDDENEGVSNDDNNGDF
jgi:hypothetical protein